MTYFYAKQSARCCGIAINVRGRNGMFVRTKLWRCEALVGEFDTHTFFVQELPKSTAHSRLRSFVSRGKSGKPDDHTIDLPLGDQCSDNRKKFIVRCMDERIEREGNADGIIEKSDAGTASADVESEVTHRARY